MPGIMPSQVVGAIDKLFNLPDPTFVQLGSGLTPQMQAVLDLLDRIPDEMLNCPASLFVDLVAARAIMEDMMGRWVSGTGNSMYAIYDRRNPVVVIRSALAACSDNPAPPVHAQLLFIDEVDLRESIRTDVGATHNALRNAEWKAATVLAGAVIEALLHWKLEKVPREAREATPRAPTVRGNKKQLNDFVLNDHMTVAHDLKILPDRTVEAVSLAKDFRNLIHPGRAIRVNERCTRGTAHLAVGAMEAVIEALGQA